MSLKQDKLKLIQDLLIEERGIPKLDFLMKLTESDLFTLMASISFAKQYSNKKIIEEVRNMKDRSKE